MRGRGIGETTENGRLLGGEGKGGGGTEGNTLVDEGGWVGRG